MAKTLPNIYLSTAEIRRSRFSARRISTWTIELLQTVGRVREDLLSRWLHSKLSSYVKAGCNYLTFKCGSTADQSCDYEVFALQFIQRKSMRPFNDGIAQRIYASEAGLNRRENL